MVMVNGGSKRESLKGRFCSLLDHDYTHYLATSGSARFRKIRLVRILYYEKTASRKQKIVERAVGKQEVTEMMCIENRISRILRMRPAPTHVAVDSMAGKRSTPDRLRDLMLYP